MQWMRGTMLAATLAGAGCSDDRPAPPAASESAAVVEAVAAPSGAPACPDDGPRLPGTGLCAGRAVNLLLFDAGERPAAPDGCGWVVNEVEFPGGDYLLYRGLQCGTRRTRLDYAGGAHFADLVLAASAFGGAGPADLPIARMTVADGRPADAVTALARSAIEDPAEAAGCSARKAGTAGWPADALVVDVAPADAARAPRDEIRTACGPFGLAEDDQRFWRVAQGYAWFFELGQEQMEIDPGSFTIVSQNDKGEYEAFQPAE